MFEAINNATFAEFAHSAIADVTVPEGKATEKTDECESFWMAETLCIVSAALVNDATTKL
jgi:mannosyl-oligosaccharide alpha-1,2-mannosidase